jgi:SAM-dependent methyltransferase
VKQRERATPPICDYEGSRYRTEFWEEGGRQYEDLAERAALRKLLPPRGQRLVEIGAGHGRLADLYGGFDEVLLVDFARSMLSEARTRLGLEGPFRYVVASIYDLPFADGVCDAAVTVRVLHHMADIPLALREVARVLCPSGTYVLEYANKRHLKAILRYALHRQNWNPFASDPVEFVRLNYDFHPTWMEARVKEAGFVIERRLAVSHFRLPLCKRLLPPSFLAWLDNALQGPVAPLRLSPSLFVRARCTRVDVAERTNYLFRCPICHTTGLLETPEALVCAVCGHRWPIVDGIYDFKQG